MSAEISNRLLFSPNAAPLAGDMLRIRTCPLLVSADSRADSLSQQRTPSTHRQRGESKEASSEHSCTSCIAFPFVLCLCVRLLAVSFSFSFLLLCSCDRLARGEGT